MSDSIIISNFLTSEYPDNHQTIYLYVNGGLRSEKLVINEIMKLSSKIFLPGINETFLKASIKEFLDEKKKLYKNGEIKVKPLF